MSMENTLSAINEKSQPSAGNVLGRDPRPVVGPDQEVWIRNQVLLAMRMAIALHIEADVRADEAALTHGLYGIAEGAAIEIIHTLNMEPGYVNLKKR
jgi:hypothetical protein